MTLKILEFMTGDFLMIFFLETPLRAVDLIYVTAGNNTVVTYDVSLGSATAIESSILSFATTNPNIPGFLAFDSAEDLYSASYSNCNISKYYSSENDLSTIATNLTGPIGIAFDSSGNFYITNVGDATISKFDQAGNFLFAWNTGSVSGASFVAFASTPVPEPSTYLLVGISGITLFWVSRRRRDNVHRELRLVNLKTFQIKFLERSMPGP